MERYYDKETRQTCELKLGELKLVDEACDGLVDLIFDSSKNPAQQRD